MKSLKQRFAEAVNERLNDGTEERPEWSLGWRVRKARERRWCRAGYVGEHDFITREVRSRNYGQDED